LRRALEERVTPAVGDVTRAAADANPRLERLAARTRATVEHALSRFVDRYARARHERDEVVTARLDKIRLALAPGGVPQERAYGWPSLAARHGAAAFKALVLGRLAREPFPTAPQDLAP
ncbi:MAG TPA: bacillithiol biosynthesis BshC, partial [Polyangia bacterium]|nr:bacillithiol biosynthesis BshC [Polyangia bacterium]